VKRFPLLPNKPRKNQPVVSRRRSRLALFTLSSSSHRRSPWRPLGDLAGEPCRRWDPPTRFTGRSLPVTAASCSFVCRGWSPAGQELRPGRPERPSHQPGHLPKTPPARRTSVLPSAPASWMPDAAARPPPAWPLQDSSSTSASVAVHRHRCRAELATSSPTTSSSSSTRPCLRATRSRPTSPRRFTVGNRVWAIARRYIERPYRHPSQDKARVTRAILVSS